MKRIIIVVIAGLIIFALITIFSKGKGKASNALPAKKGKTTGEIKPKTKAEIDLERKKVTLLEKAQKGELRRRRRAERRARLSGRIRNGVSSLMTRGGRRTSGGYSSRTGGKGNTQLYKLSAIFTIENENFALIDGRQVTKGDDIMGRKIVEILSDRIVMNEFGRTREVKLGESVIPSLITPNRTR